MSIHIIDISTLSILAESAPNSLKTGGIIRGRIEFGIPGYSLGPPAVSGGGKLIDQVSNLIHNLTLDSVLEEPFMVGIGPPSVLALLSFHDLFHRFDPIIVSAMNHFHHILGQSPQTIGKGTVKPGLTEGMTDNYDYRGIPAGWVFRTVVFCPYTHSFLPDCLDGLLVGPGNCILLDVQNGDIA